MNTKHNLPKRSAKRTVIGSLLLTLFVIIGMGIAATDSESGLSVFQKIKNVIPGLSEMTAQQPTANELTTGDLVAENRAIQALDAEDLATQNPVVKEFDAEKMAIQPLVTKDLSTEQIAGKTVITGDLAGQGSAIVATKALAVEKEMADKAVAQETITQDVLTPMEATASGGMVEADSGADPDEILLNETEAGFTSPTLLAVPMSGIGGSVSGN